MRKVLLVAAAVLATTGCADKQKLNTALAESQRLSAEKDSLLNEVLANAEMVSGINAELAKVRDLGANPVTAGEGVTSANDQRTVVVGKIRDAITRLQQSEEALEAAKKRRDELSSRLNRADENVRRLERELGAQRAGPPDERWCVLGHRVDREARAFEHELQPLAHQQLVLADHDAHGITACPVVAALDGRSTACWVRPGGAPTGAGRRVRRRPGSVVVEQRAAMSTRGVCGVAWQNVRIGRSMPSWR